MLYLRVPPRYRFNSFLVLNSLLLYIIIMLRFYH
nr:MAG TPA: hypothetical protein [Caudoviricetes sp.]